MNLVDGALALGAYRHGHGLLTDGVQTSAGISWKVAVAAYLKETTDVSNPWLAGQLDMGSPVYVSKHVGQLRNGGGRTGSGRNVQHSGLSGGFPHSGAYYDSGSRDAGGGAHSSLTG